MKDFSAVEKVLAERRLYVTPRLEEYGHVEKLTKGTTGAGADMNGKHA